MNTTTTTTIELKNLKIYEGMSEETTAFTATLCVNGKNIAHCKNDGHGGNTFIQLINREDAPLLKEAEDFCKALPEYVFEGGVHQGGEPYTVKWDLELFVDDIVDKKSVENQIKKVEKSLGKKMLTAILVGIKGNIESYGSYKFKLPLADILKSEKGRESLKTSIRKIKSELKAGEEILNTNIPADIMEG